MKYFHLFKRKLIYSSWGPYVGLVFLTSLFLFPFLHAGVPLGHDSVGHIVRISEYTNALRDGQFPVRWASSINYHYGSPVFIFYYPLPYYLGALIHLSGISLEKAFILVLLGSYLLSPICFYFWVSQQHAKKIAFAGALLYGLMPYHFLDLFVRADFGELLALGLVPLVFYFLDKIIRKFSLQTVLLGGVLYGLLLLSHNGISLMFTPIYIGYVFFQSKGSFKALIQAFLLLGYGLLLACFFWLPALFEHKYIITLSIFDFMYKNHFSKLGQLIYSSWGFGPDVGKSGGLSAQVGPFSVTIVILSIWNLLKVKKQRMMLLFWLSVFLLGIFLATPLASPLYEHTKLLRQFQFPWRFIALSSFAATVLAVYLFSRFSQKLLVISILLVTIFSFSYVRVNRYTSHADAYYQSLQDLTFYHAEATPRWVSGNESVFPESPIEVIGGQAKVYDYKKYSSYHQFSLHASVATQILDNTTYFPGWKVFVDGKEIPVEFQDSNHKGLLTYRVDAGEHRIAVFFQETTIRKFSDIVSLTSVFVAVILIGIDFYRRKKAS